MNAFCVFVFCLLFWKGFIKVEPDLEMEKKEDNGGALPLIQFQPH